MLTRLRPNDNWKCFIFLLDSSSTQQALAFFSVARTVESEYFFLQSVTGKHLSMTRVEWFFFVCVYLSTCYQLTTSGFMSNCLKLWLTNFSMFVVLLSLRFTTWYRYHKTMKYTFESYLVRKVQFPWDALTDQFKYLYLSLTTSEQTSELTAIRKPKMRALHLPLGISLWKFT